MLLVVGIATGVKTVAVENFGSTVRSSKRATALRFIGRTSFYRRVRV
jgi:hypothetical protein